MSIKLCGYGCGREAKYPPRKGKTKWSCENSYQNCPSNYHSRSLEEVKCFLINKGYKWISGVYKNEMSELILCCKNGHKYITNFNNLNSGGGCPICSGITYWNIEKVKEFAFKRNYKCLTTAYKSSDKKIKLQCKCGYIFDMRWDIFVSGAICPKCTRLHQSIKVSGSGNSNWRGGISCEPYCDLWNNKEFKEVIKIRDNYSCMNPCCRSKNPKNICIHHIDYDKKNCIHTNLITLCNSCNASANYNRSWHIIWYRIIMYRRYGFYYS